jgi:spermidine/putrescine-binding protein
MTPLFTAFLSLFTLFMISQTNEALGQQQTLSILCPASLLDSKILTNFERKKKIALRVELATGAREFEQRLKSSSNVYDVVIADENEILVLTAARLLRPLPDSRFAEKKKSALSVPSKVQQEAKTYVNIMADPLGLIWLDDTRTQQSIPSWAELLDMSTNPLWRGRLFLPPDPDFQKRLALFATGLTNFRTLPDTAPQAAEWLKKASVHIRPEANQLVLELLKKRTVAGVLWKSDYLRVRNTIPSLDFAIPPATLFRRFGAAIVADTLREELAFDFISHLIEHRDDLARFAGITPLFPAPEKESEGASWTLFDTSVPLSVSLEKSFSSPPAKQSP